jgi:hypothetical protein
MEADDNSLRIAPDALGENRHVCAFFNSCSSPYGRRAFRSNSSLMERAPRRRRPTADPPGRSTLGCRAARRPAPPTRAAQAARSEGEVARWPLHLIRKRRWLPQRLVGS